jgi:hypothetical protein
MDRDSNKPTSSSASASSSSQKNENNSKAVVCTNKQLIIYEYLNKAQNLMVNNSETLLSS